MISMKAENEDKRIINITVDASRIDDLQEVEVFSKRERAVNPEEKIRELEKKVAEMEATLKPIVELFESFKTR